MKNRENKSKYLKAHQYQWLIVNPFNNCYIDYRGKIEKNYNIKCQAL
jgi:hypothetical protein